MGHAVLKISKPHLYLVDAEILTDSAARQKAKAATRVTVFLFMASLQVCDGILTAVGIHSFGVSAEGNVVLRYLMELMGYIPAILVAKTFAFAVLAGLYYMSKRVTWIVSALKGLSVIYIIAAIIPWTWILISRLLLS